MGTLLFSAALMGVAHGECADLPGLVRQMEVEALGDHPEEVAQLRLAAEQALGCGPAISPDLLTRFWLADGVAAVRRGDEAGAGLSFSAALQVAPGEWPEIYGPELHRIYLASGEAWRKDGTIRVHPPANGLLVTLDGVEITLPATATEGLHVLQVGLSRDETLYAEVFQLLANETHFVLTGLDEPDGGRTSLGLRLVGLASPPMDMAIGAGAVGVELAGIRCLGEAPGHGPYAGYSLGAGLIPAREPEQAGVVRDARPLYWLNASGGYQGERSRLRYRLGWGVDAALIPPDWLDGQPEDSPPPGAHPSEDGWYLWATGPSLGFDWLLGEAWAAQLCLRPHASWLDLEGDGSPELLLWSSLGLGVMMVR